MYCFFDKSQNREAINISPGEYFISPKGMLIHTLIGSCVAVAMYDPQTKIGGMNHFSAAQLKDIPYDAVLQHAEESMKNLVSALLENGCSRTSLEAKILGGSNLSEPDADDETTASNIRFAEEYLQNANIKIVGRDTGGNEARKIYLHTDTFKILLKRLPLVNTDLESQMQDYRRRLKRIPLHSYS